MDKKLLTLAKEYAETLVAYYQAPCGNANAQSQDRRQLLVELTHVHQQLSNRAQEVAEG